MKTVIEISKEIIALTEERDRLIRSANRIPENLSEAASLLLLSYRGRELCDQEELGSGYLGSTALSVHLAQVADKDSWVHASMSRWLRKAVSK